MKREDFLRFLRLQIPSVGLRTSTDEFVELKIVSGGVGDHVDQSEIMTGRRPIWKDVKGSWEQDQNGYFEEA